MNTKKLIALFVVVVLMSGLFLGLNNAKAKEPVPDLITSPSSIIVMDPNVDGQLETGIFGIITRITPNYIAVAVDDKGNSVIQNDIFIFANFSGFRLQITQGVFMKLIKEKAYLYFAHAKIITVPKGELSTWSPAITRINDQELISGKIIDVEKTGGLGSEDDYCCHPVVKKTWYYVKIDIATEDEQTVTMKMGVEVPEEELDVILSSKGSYLWLSQRYQKVYILVQEH